MLQQIFSLSFMTAFLAAAVRLAVPLMYGGIGETIAEKSGILNIGMEGVMICPLSSRQVKYLKVSDKNTYISFWSVGIFMHTISLYIF